MGGELPERRERGATCWRACVNVLVRAACAPAAPSALSTKATRARACLKPNVLQGLRFLVFRERSEWSKNASTRKSERCARCAMGRLRRAACVLDAARLWTDASRITYDATSSIHPCERGYGCRQRCVLATISRSGMTWGGAPSAAMKSRCPAVCLQCACCACTLRRGLARVSSLGSRV